MLGKPHILSLFPNSFNKFNKTWALISDPLFMSFQEGEPSKVKNFEPKKNNQILRIQSWQVCDIKLFSDKFLILAPLCVSGVSLFVLAIFFVPSIVIEDPVSILLLLVCMHAWVHTCVQQALSLTITTGPWALIIHMCIPYGKYILYKYTKIYDLDISPTFDLVAKFDIGELHVLRVHLSFLNTLLVCFWECCLLFTSAAYVQMQRLCLHETLSHDQRKQFDHNDCNMLSKYISICQRRQHLSLTFKAPRKNASENVVCWSHLLQKIA